MKKLLAIMIVGVICAALVACDADTPQVASAPQNSPKGPAAKPTPAKVEAAVVEKEPEVPFVYNPSGKRDPFVSLVTVRKPVVEQQVPLTPLQQYDLSQFRLIAAIIGKDEPKAMVEAPGGKPFVLKKGVLIGKNSGVVIDINSQEVVVEEKYYDFSGAVRKAINKIEFPPKQGVN